MDDPDWLERFEERRNPSTSSLTPVCASST
jgi:hypothetical protein